MDCILPSSEILSLTLGSRTVIPMDGVAKQQQTLSCRQFNFFFEATKTARAISIIQELQTINLRARTLILIYRLVVYFVQHRLPWLRPMPYFSEDSSLQTRYNVARLAPEAKMLE